MNTESEHFVEVNPQQPADFSDWLIEKPWQLNQGEMIVDDPRHRLLFQESWGLSA